ncbi:MAG: SUMF1/EgtB/PvdO family nonheme iron enzyme, partial [Fimbriimonadaceae bacterium]|nr:SUMF1/EgtB/PvdO family nonheme iron enzyme [Chitinophagales bacterium]
MKNIKHIFILFFTLLFIACSVSKTTTGINDNLYKGMILLAAGEAKIGNNSGFSGESPEFIKHIDAFYLDEHEVTVVQFRKFIEATQYVTEAERFGDGGVFNMENKQWYLQKGATWHHPFGADGVVAEDDHPVTQVSWNDAIAYSKWAGKRLPTEFEFEYAAKNAGSSNEIYAWGNTLVENNFYMANTWQGHFPDMNLGKDGFLYTSPVGSFGKNTSGFEDMGGNVWEWTNSWYQPHENTINGIIDSSSNLRV